MSEGAPRRERTSLLAAILIVTAAYGVLVWPALLGGGGGTSEAGDQNAYHLPIVRAMIEQWPEVDVVGYRSATAPGYHLALAASGRVLGDDVRRLRLVNSLVGLGLVLVVLVTTARSAPPRAAPALVAPFLCSSYVVSGSIWLTTDNAALLWVVLAWGGAVMLAATPARLLRWGTYTTAAVLVRQIHLWPAGVVAAAGALALPIGEGLARRLGSSRPVSGDRRPAPAALALATGAAVALPTAALALLALNWGGLTPPAYRDLHDAGVNPVTLGVALALVGGLGPFFAWTVWPAFVRGLREAGPAAAVLVAIAALAATLVWPTSYDMDAGRWGGGLWSAVNAAPTLADRSVILPPLAVVGALVLLGMTRAARARGRGREAALVLLGLMGLIAAQSFNSQCWQRYLEPSLLVALAWLAALAGSGASGPRRWWLGPAALALIQLGICGLTLYAKIWSGGGSS